MANETEDGVPPPPTNPPDTRILDQRIRAALETSSLGGGGDGSGPSDVRIAKLEVETSRLNDSMKEVRDALRSQGSEISGVLQRLSGIDAEIRHKPGKGFIVTAVVATLSFFSAVILFQDQIKHLIGIAAGK